MELYDVKGDKTDKFYQGDISNTSIIRFLVCFFAELIISSLQGFEDSTCLQIPEVMK